MTPKSQLSIWNVVGLLGAGSLALLSVVLLFIDENAPSELELARAAVEEARDVQLMLSDDYEQAVIAEANLSRSTELYNAMTSMRELIEQLSSSIPEDRKLVELIMAAAGRALMVASDFKLAEHWTLLVYRAEPNPEKTSRQLRCVGGKRSIDCTLEEARVWPEGIGAAGIALSRAQEVLVPDLQAPELGSLHQIGTHRRDHDELRYRSICAVPITLASHARPWGVVVATSDRPEHFGIDQGPGVRTAEASRALAGMVALAVAIRGPDAT